MDYPVVRKFGQSPVCGDQHVSIAQNSSLVVLEYANYVLNIKTALYDIATDVWCTHRK